MTSARTPVAKFCKGSTTTDSIIAAPGASPRRDSPSPSLAGPRPRSAPALRSALRGLERDMDRHLILASASPRRAELLASAGFTFRVRAAEVDETPHCGRSARAVRDRAWPARKRPRCVGMLGKRATSSSRADTPSSSAARCSASRGTAADAARMLHSLSDTVHEVLTGVVVLAGDREDQQVVRTRVHFLPLSSDDIDGTSERRAGWQSRRVRHPGPGGALHRLDRRLLVERGGVTGGDGPPDAQKPRRVEYSWGGFSSRRLRCLQNPSRSGQPSLDPRAGLRGPVVFVPQRRDRILQARGRGDGESRPPGRASACSSTASSSTSRSCVSRTRSTTGSRCRTTARSCRPATPASCPTRSRAVRRSC